MSPLGCWLALLLRAAAAKDIFSFGGPLHPAVTVISLVTTLRPKPIEMAVDLCVRHLPTPPSLGAVHSELIPSENIVPILICRTYFFKHKKT